MKEALGKHTFERYLEAKEEEWDDFRIHVTEWEIKRYLESSVILIFPLFFIYFHLKQIA